MISANRYIQEVSPGKFRCWPELRRRLPLWLTLPKSDQVYPVVSTTNMLTSNFTLPNWSIEHPGAAIMKYMVFADSTDGTSVNNSTIKLTDIGYQRDFMSNPLHMRAIFGTAQLPGVLHEPAILDANSVLRAQITQISGGSVNLRPYIVGCEFYDGDKKVLDLLAERKKVVQPFWMMPDNTTVVTLTANQTLNFVAQNGRGHFQGLSIVAVSTGAFSLEIQERRTGRTIMNGKITLSNGIGNAQYPYFFEAPFLVERSSDLRFTFTDLSNSGNTIYCAIQGKMFMCPMKEIPAVEKELMIPWDKLRA